MTVLLIRCCKHALYVSKQVIKVFSIRLIKSYGSPNRIRSIIPNDASADGVIILLVHRFFLSIKVLLLVQYSAYLVNQHI